MIHLLVKGKETCHGLWCNFFAQAGPQVRRVDQFVRQHLSTFVPFHHGEDERDIAPSKAWQNGYLLYQSSVIHIHIVASHCIHQNLCFAAMPHDPGGQVHEKNEGSCQASTHDFRPSKEKSHPKQLPVETVFPPASLLIFCRTQQSLRPEKPRKHEKVRFGQPLELVAAGCSLFGNAEHWCSKGHPVELFLTRSCCLPQSFSKKIFEIVNSQSQIFS